MILILSYKTIKTNKLKQVFFLVKSFFYTLSNKEIENYY
jgi:hypothetical protein